LLQVVAVPDKAATEGAFWNVIVTSSVVTGQPDVVNDHLRT